MSQAVAFAALVVATAAFVTPGPILAQTASEATIERQAIEIRDRFMAAVRDCGFVPTYEPAVVVETHSSIIAYFFDERAAYLSRWADLPPPTQEMLRAWAAEGSLGLDPEQQFSEIFHSLLLPHELAHYLQHESGRHETLDLWESEVEANRIAIAFWSLDPTDAARLPARIENYMGFLGALPSPVPAGQQPRKHFNTNYEALGDDADAYGWYQGAFMRTAWAERGKTDFCDLVRLNAPS